MAQMQVFLSHSSADKDVAERVVVALRRAGADVWFDEHNLGATQLLDEIMRQLRARPVFIVLLSQTAFASDWVKRECKWAFNIQMRNPSHIILPVVISPIDPNAFDEMLYLEDFKRVEGPHNTPYPEAEMLERTLRLLALTPASQAPIPSAPQSAESLGDLMTQGLALAAQQRWAEALFFFQRVTKRDPASADAWGNLGWMLGKLMRFDEALVACDRSLALNDRQAWVWDNKGVTLGALERYEEALTAFDSALALDPNEAIAWNNKVAALVGLGRNEEALVASERALAFDSNDTTSWMSKGLALDGLGRSEEALAAFDSALALDASLALAWSSKAIALRNLGRIAEAGAAERRAKELGG